MKDFIPHSCPDIGPDESDALVGVVKSLYVGGGPQRKRLETVVSSDQGYAEGIATTTGSQAIHLALRAMFPRGKARVAVPDYICRSVYDAVLCAACCPVVVDIDPDHLGPQVDAVKQAEADAVIVAHLYGILAPLEDYFALGLPIIEDCAQRLSLRESARSEPKGTVRILSFEARKLLTCGEGGMLLTDDRTVAKRARNLRDGPYDFSEPALSMPMTDLQASMALVQWGRLPEFFDKRASLANFYLEGLEPEFKNLIFSAMYRPNTRPFRFLLWVEDPKEFIRSGAEMNVAFRIPLAPLTLHQLFGTSGNFSVSDNVMGHLVSIPFYPRLTEAQSEIVLHTVQRSLRARK